MIISYDSKVKGLFKLKADKNQSNYLFFMNKIMKKDDIIEKTRKLTINRFQN
jgi:hypothetical protein